MSKNMNRISVAVTQNNTEENCVILHQDIEGCIKQQSDIRQLGITVYGEKTMFLAWDYISTLPEIIEYVETEFAEYLI